MTLLAQARTGSALKERKKSSVSMIKTLGAGEKAGCRVTVGVVGSGLPRSVRARLGRGKAQATKPTGVSKKAAPKAIAAGVWQAGMDDNDMELPAVLYSDKKGVTHDSLTVQQGSVNLASADLAGLKHPSEPQHGMTTRLQLKEARNSAMWTSKRSANSVKSMSRTIQQACPRTLSHN